MSCVDISHGNAPVTVDGHATTRALELPVANACAVIFIVTEATVETKKGFVVSRLGRPSSEADA